MPYKKSGQTVRCRNLLPFPAVLLNQYQLPLLHMKKFIDNIQLTPTFMPLLRLVLTPATVVEYADLIARTYNPGLNSPDSKEFFNDQMTIYLPCKLSSILEYTMIQNLIYHKVE